MPTKKSSVKTSTKKISTSRSKPQNPKSKLSSTVNFASLANIVPPPPPYIPERTMTESKKDICAHDRCISSWKSKLLAVGIFILPFIAIPWTLSIHEFPKQTYLTLIVGIGLIIFIAGIFKSGKLDLIPQHIGVPFAFGGLIIMGISALMSDVKWHGIIGFTGTESLSLLTFVLFALWTLLVFHATHNKISLILKTLIASSSVLSIITILSLLSVNIYAFTSLTGFNPVGTTTAASTIAAISIILSAGYWLNSKSIKQSIFPAIAIIFPIILLLGAGFRIPIILTAIGLIILLLLKSFGSNRNFSSLKVNILIGASILAIFLAIYPFTAIIQTPLEVAPSHKETWSIMTKSIAENPIIGSGPGSFNSNYLKYRSTDILQTPFWNIGFDWGSSSILTLFSTLGILGSSLFIVSILIILIQYGLKILSNKLQSNESSGAHELVLTTGITLFIAGFLLPMPITLHFLFVTILGLILAASSKPIVIGQNGAERPSHVLSMIGSVVIVIVLAGFIIQGKHIVAESLAHKGLKTNKEDVTLQTSLLARAVQMSPRNDTYLRLLTNVQRMTLQKRLQSDPTNQDPQIAIQQLRNIADATLATARTATNNAPGNVANWSLLGNAYLDISAITTGALKAAEEAFSRANELSPNDPAILVNLSISKSNTGQPGSTDNNSTELLKQAIAVRPSFSSAHLELARILGTQGDTEGAISSYNNVTSLTPNDPAIYYEVGLFYIQNEQYDNAAIELEKAISLSPNFSNARWFLAEAYEKQEQIAQAIKQIEEIIELNPENEQAKTRLAELNELE